jgi:hypothetical protein
MNPNNQAQMRYMYEQGFVKRQAPVAETPQTFKQCFWHVDGQMVCKNVTPKPVSQSQYIQFDTFDRPNANYQPQAYLQNIDWYAQKRDASNAGYPSISTPHTFDRVGPNGFAGF